MFKWVQQWGFRKQEKEIDGFLQLVRQAASDELGYSVAAAADFRNYVLHKENLDLYYPAHVLLMRPAFTVELSLTVSSLQKANNPMAAVPLIIWAHTLRAMSNLLIRDKGRELWSELSRGFPYIEGGALLFIKLNGRLCDTTDAGRVPDGLGPK